MDDQQGLEERLEAEEIRVLIVEDHEYYIDGLTFAFKIDPGLKVTGRAEDAKRAQEAIETGGFDILLIDLAIPQEKEKYARFSSRLPKPEITKPDFCVGFALIKYAVKTQPEAKIVALTCSHALGHYFRAKYAGAHAYLLKDRIDKEIVDRLLAVYAGKNVSTSSELDSWDRKLRLDGFDFPYGLTERQMEILEYMKTEISDQALAEKYGLSKKTISRDRKEICSKLGVKKDREATAKAQAEGLIN